MKIKKSLLVSMITIGLQLGTTTNAEGIVGSDVTVMEQNQIPVVNINDANIQGLSHNTYEQLNINGGLVLNNSTQNIKTELAGEIAANPNLHNQAKIILNEVIGTSSSHLNGVLEVAGQKADVIIVNPNGMVVNKLQFINTDRAVLTTGTPQILDGKLDGFQINKGKIDVQGNINDNYVVNDEVKHGSISKVALLAQAVKINGEIFAQDEIKVVTGNNEVKYEDGKVKQLNINNSKAGISLDVAALGGMYANSIMLVGTDKGLGVNLEGTIQAEGDLDIDAAGNLFVMQHINKDGENSVVKAEEKLHIKATELHNEGNILAGKKLNIDTKKLENINLIQSDSTAKINADNVVNDGIISTNQDLNIKVKGNITGDGGLASKEGQITIDADKVKLNRANISVKNKSDIIINEANPDPKEDKVQTLPEKKELEVKGNPELNPVENLPKESELVANAKDLSLKVDTNANKNYQPILDKTRNGIDLINIAQVDGRGVSLNKYTDFHVKSRGLILNNATKYSNTKLAGYIDKNMFLAGRGAKTIINEVTSTKKSIFNGYVEVAGNPADLVFINPNGMEINGLGFINSCNISFNSLGNIDVLGKGLNGQEQDKINIQTGNFYVLNSELWAQDLKVIAKDKFVNTGKIGINNLDLKATDVENTGFIEGKNNINIDSTSLAQVKGTIKTTNNLQVQTKTFNNSNNSLLEADSNVKVIADNLLNNQSNIVSNGVMDLKTAQLSNENKAVILAKDKLSIVGDNLQNNNSTIASKGSAVFDLKSNLENKDNGIIDLAGKTIFKLQGKLLNNDSKIRFGDKTSIQAKNITNENEGYLELVGPTEIKGQNLNNHTGILLAKDNLNIDLAKDFHNEDSLVSVSGNLNLKADNIYNWNKSKEYYGSEINVAGNATINAINLFENRSSDVEVQQDLNLQAEKIVNQKEIFATNWAITEEDKYEKIPHLKQANYYDADRKYHRIIHTGEITKETADGRIISSGNIKIDGKELTNHYSQIMAGKDLSINVDNLENIGYQGTIHYDDLGRDRHYWKYKKKRRWWKRSRWVHGHTDFHYENHEVFDQEPTINSERIAVLGSNGQTIIKAGKFVNKTLEADGNEYALRAKKVSTEFTKAKTPAVQSLDNALLAKILSNTQKIYLQSDPLATYTKEEDQNFTDKKAFLSSDYMLVRLKTNPELVSKALADGYAEQELVKEQLRQLRNRDKIGTASDEATYKKLMDNGLVAARTLDLRPGISLTAEQTMKLTSDIVWLEKINTPEGEKLIPKVYLTRLHNDELRQDGSIVLGKDVKIFSDELVNIGTIKGENNLNISADVITNKGGQLLGTDLTIKANGLQNLSGNITAKGNLQITADSINNATEINSTKINNYEQNFIHNPAEITAGNNLQIKADKVDNLGANIIASGDLDLNAKDLNLSAIAKTYHLATTGAKVDSKHYLGSNLVGKDVAINVNNAKVAGSTIKGNNVEINAGNLDVINKKNYEFSDVSIGSRGSDYFNRKKTVDEEILGSKILADKDIKLNVAKDLNLKASEINSSSGVTEIKAGNVNITNDYEQHELLEEYHKKDRGFLSSKTTDIYNHQMTDKVVGSNISSNSLDVNSNKDILIKASTVVADEELKLQAQGNIDITSATETSVSKYVKQVKKSGIFSNGGLSVNIGKTKQKDSYDSITSTEIGSVIGSNYKSVEINAPKDVDIKATDIMAKNDINIIGGKVTIQNGVTTQINKEKHEYSSSGLSLSLSNQLLSTASDFVNTIKASENVSDKRLNTLLKIKGIDDARRSLNKNNVKTQSKSLSLNVSIGKSDFSSNSQLLQTIEDKSNLVAHENIKIVTNNEDLTIKGTDLTGKNIELNSAKDINITGLQNTSTFNSNSKSSSSSVGISYDLLKNTVDGINISSNSAKELEQGTDITHKLSVIAAEDLVKIKSGESTSIVSSKIKGTQVIADVKGDLNITSLQDVHDYDNKGTSSGLGLDGNKTKLNNATINKSYSNINSKYKSVVQQSGIYADEKDFQVDVGNKTSLVGSVLAGNGDNNHLNTKSLVVEDINNFENYNATGQTISLSKADISKYNPLGFANVVDIPIAGNGSSITKSAISNGDIEILDGYDLSLLNRDTEHATNSLDNSFDKGKILEKKQFINEFSKLSYNYIGDYASYKRSVLIEKAKKETDAQVAANYMKEADKWSEGGLYKNIAHGLAAGMLTKQAGGSPIKGITAGALNELAKKYDPDLANIIAQAITTKDKNQISAVISQANKFNWLDHLQQLNFTNLLYQNADNKDEQAKTIAYFAALNEYNNKHYYGEEPNYVESDLANALILAGAVTNYDVNNGMNYTLNKSLISFTNYYDMFNGYKAAYGYRSWLESRKNSFKATPPPKGAILPWYEITTSNYKIPLKTSREHIEDASDVLKGFPKQTLEKILKNNGSITKNGYFMDGYGNVYTSLGYAGDYFAKQGNPIVYDEIGRAYARVGEKDYYAPSKNKIEEFSYSKSLVMNMVSEKINFIPEQLVKEGAIKNSIVKNTIKGGGVTTVYFLGSAIKENVDTFKGTKLVEAIVIDASGIIGGNIAGAYAGSVIGGALAPEPMKGQASFIGGVLGSIFGGMTSDRGAYFLKKMLKE